ncbi:MAG: hypothetical protein ACI8ZF_000910 [Candidatus Midichloriaceae bacterium]|jgi:hypothetical protein
MSLLGKRVWLVATIINICFFEMHHAYGYAWERGKNKKYRDYGIMLDPGYSTEFKYIFDKYRTLRFKDVSKKLILSKYDEKGLTDRFTLISKLDIQRINANLEIEKEEIEEEYSNFDSLDEQTAAFIKNKTRNNKRHLPIRSLKAKMNFTGIDYEIGIRTLLYKKDKSRISVDTILSFPSAIQGEGGSSISNPSLLLGMSYGTLFDFKDFKNNFFEVMIATKWNSAGKKNDLYSVATVSTNLSEEVSAAVSIHNNYRYSNSFERFVFTQIYKKYATKNLDEEDKKKLDDFILNHSLISKKKTERKINTKLSYKCNNKYTLAFDYFYQIAKDNVNPHAIKFSLIKTF